MQGPSSAPPVDPRAGSDGDEDVAFSFRGSAPSTARVIMTGYATDEESMLTPRLAETVALHGNWASQRWAQIARPVTKLQGKMIVAGLVLVALVAVVATADPCKVPFIADLGREVQLSTQIDSTADTLKAVSSKKQADAMVERAVKAAGRAALARHNTSLLPPSYRDLVSRAALHANEDVRQKDALNQFNFRQAFCVFNAIESADGIGGTSVDIESMVRTCPSPRGATADFACAVNAETLVEMVGTIATWLSTAVSTCGVTANVGAQCAAGIAGIVSAVSEVAASATLAATTCKAEPMAGLATPETLCIGDDCETGRGARISQIGSQNPGRRLFIGSGLGANPIQCGVDTGFLVDNIMNIVYYIQQAVNGHYCDKDVRNGRYNARTGVPDAACAMDVAGTIAWFTQIGTFLSQLINHCPDLLNVHALCASSITGMISSASQIASWGAAIHISCAEDESLRTVSELVTFQEPYYKVRGKEGLFLKECTCALESFGVECIFVRPDNVTVTLQGTKEGLDMARCVLDRDGLDLPNFPPFDPLCTDYDSKHHTRDDNNFAKKKAAWEAKQKATAKAKAQANKPAIVSHRRLQDAEPKAANLRDLHALRQQVEVMRRNLSSAEGDHQASPLRSDLKRTLRLMETAFDQKPGVASKRLPAGWWPLRAQQCEA